MPLAMPLRPFPSCAVTIAGCGFGSSLPCFCACPADAATGSPEIGLPPPLSPSVCMSEPAAVSHSALLAPAAASPLLTSTLRACAVASADIPAASDALRSAKPATRLVLGLLAERWGMREVPLQLPLPLPLTSERALLSTAGPASMSPASLACCISAHWTSMPPPSDCRLAYTTGQLLPMFSHTYHFFGQRGDERRHRQRISATMYFSRNGTRYGI